MGLEKSESEGATEAGNVILLKQVCLCVCVSVCFILPYIVKWSKQWTFNLRRLGFNLSLIISSCAFVGKLFKCSLLKFLFSLFGKFL